MDTIYTIGHSTLAADIFADHLERHGIDLLVDIRRYPGSRREPQFNQDPLREALELAGIGYLHLPALGGRRRPSPDSANVAWHNASFRGYADYMETAEFQVGLQELMELGRTNQVAIMCAESVWWRCHRSLVADALMAQDWRVLHIMSDGTVKPHHFTSPARLEHGTLTYREAMAGDVDPPA